MPTWTVKNGQDDIVWHKASVNGKVASVKIPASQHKSEAGEYITHIYLYTNSGNVLVKGAYVDLTDCSQAVSFDHKHGWEFVDGSGIIIMPEEKRAQVLYICKQIRITLMMMAL